MHWQGCGELGELLGSQVVSQTEFSPELELHLIIVNYVVTYVHQICRQASVSLYIAVQLLSVAQHG